MEHIQTVAERIAKLVPGASHPIAGTEVNIRYFVSDICKLVKNIRETSFCNSDTLMRIEKMSEETGISIDVLKQLFNL